MLFSFFRTMREMDNLYKYATGNVDVFYFQQLRTQTSTKILVGNEHVRISLEAIYDYQSPPTVEINYQLKGNELKTCRGVWAFNFFQKYITYLATQGVL